MRLAPPPRLLARRAIAYNDSGLHGNMAYRPASPDEQHRAKPCGGRRTLLPVSILTNHTPTGGIDSQPPATGTAPFHVTSLTEGRVSVVKRDGEFIVTKHTKDVEFTNLTRASQWLRRAGHFTGHKLGRCVTVAVPRILKWDAEQQLLDMAFCHGNNVETALMENTALRPFYVALLSDLLSWIRAHSFYWKNFAPRNVLYDHSTDTVYLVDFESPLRIGRRRMSNRSFTFYCQDNVILELSAVLFQREQEIVCPKVWDYCRSGSLSIAGIEGRRKRRFIQLTYPTRRRIRHTELTQIQQRIAEIASPFFFNGSIYYPLHALSGLTNITLYVNTVLELERQKRNFWPSIIDSALAEAPRPE